MAFHWRASTLFILCCACAASQPQPTARLTPGGCEVHGGPFLQFRSRQRVADMAKALASTYKPPAAAEQIKSEMGKWIRFDAPDATLEGMITIKVDGVGCYDYLFENAKTHVALTDAARAQVAVGSSLRVHVAVNLDSDGTPHATSSIR